MQNLLLTIRSYDYQYFLLLHDAIAGRPWLNEFYLFFAKYGIVLIVLSFIYLIIKRTINAFICSFLAMGISILADVAIVIFWQRHRPFITHSNEVLRPITEGLRVTSISFPSGHAYIAFAIATSIFLYGHKKLGIVLYILAILVAIGRVGAGLHYPSDIIGGALLGIASGIAAYLIVQAKQKAWE